jgi:hypothetical protein
MVLMLVEIVLNMLIDPKYCGSFFFWLDFTCKISMFLDISSINKIIFVKSSKEIAKAGKASRLGTKASKVVRVIRLLRLIRAAKLYSQAKKRSEEEEEKLLFEDKSFVSDRKKLNML